MTTLEASTFTGRVSEVGVAAKEGARLFRVVVKVPNPDGVLRSGMTASVALVVTRFSGAGTLKLEHLVTKKLEEKIDKLESIEEITSQSRPGVSVITVKQRPDKEAHVQQEGTNSAPSSLCGITPE